MFFFPDPSGPGDPGSECGGCDAGEVRTLDDSGFGMSLGFGGSVGAGRKQRIIRIWLVVTGR